MDAVCPVSFDCRETSFVKVIDVGPFYTALLFSAFGSPESPRRAEEQVGSLNHCTRVSPLRAEGQS